MMMTITYFSEKEPPKKQGRNKGSGIEGGWGVVSEK